MQCLACTNISLALRPLSEIALISHLQFVLGIKRNLCNSPIYRGWIWTSAFRHIEGIGYVADAIIIYHCLATDSTGCPVKIFTTYVLVIMQAPKVVIAILDLRPSISVALRHEKSFEIVLRGK